jgi:murein DD-endopeptidase MepM/ murein hydrolase activator NlpD
MFLRAPLNFRRISSFFSNSRWHPVLRFRRPHQGIDYAAPEGTPVVSIGQGTVRAAGWRGGFGKAVEIRHAGGYTTLYGHLSRYGPGIRSGVHVRQGQVIGHVGSTGIATGPHLDFRIAKDGKWFNFLSLKLPKATAVAKARRAAYSSLLRQRLPALGAEGL